MIDRSSSKLAPHQHPMRVVTRRTGLSADLLRAWERRYEVVRPSRSKGGRRLYSDADIERLGLLYRATLAGRGIGQLARLSTAELAALVRRDAEAEAERPREGGQSQHAAASTADQLSHFFGDCFRAIERLDTIALDGLLRRAVIALPADVLLDGLFAPLLERIGTRWRDGTLRPMHGHLASAVLRRVLDDIIGSATSTVSTPSILVTTPAGQIHEFGAMLVAATAAAEGWRVTYLGANLPAEEIAAAAAQTGARAVALSIVHPTSDPAVSHELRQLRTLLPKRVALVVGGSASAAYGAVLEDIRAEPASDLAEFRSQLRFLRRRVRRR